MPPLILNSLVCTSHAIRSFHPALSKTIGEKGALESLVLGSWDTNTSDSRSLVIVRVKAKLVA